MKIYLAGPWVDRHACMTIAGELKAHGHTITQPWWEYESKENALVDPSQKDTFYEECAKADVKGVRDADLLIVWNTHKSEGKAAEQGMAIAWEIPIICITPDERPSSNIFHHLHGNYTHVKTVAEAIEAIKEYQ